MFGSKPWILKSLVVGVFLAGIMFSMPGSPKAALVSYTADLAGQSQDPYPNPLLPLASDGSISLMQFNPSLGTLNSVTLQLSSVFLYSDKFENTGNGTSDFSKTIDQHLTIGTLLDTGKQTYTLTRNGIAVYDGTLDYAGTSGFNTGTVSNGATNASHSFTAGSMVPYIGTGSVLLGVSSHAASFVTWTGGNGSHVPTQDFVTSATVTYDFTAVPIPGAVWLLGSGLVGLVGLRKKFSR